MPLTFPGVRPISLGSRHSPLKTLQTEPISRFSRFVIRVKDWFGQSAKSKLVTQPPYDNASPCERAVSLIDTRLANVRADQIQQRRELRKQCHVVENIDRNSLRLKDALAVSEQKWGAAAQKLQNLHYILARPKDLASIEKQGSAEIMKHAQTMRRIKQTLSNFSTQRYQIMEKCSALESSIKSSEQEIEQLTADIQTKKSATNDRPVLRRTELQDLLE